MTVGKWDPWYTGLGETFPYGGDLTYRLGATFLSDCARVEDWGCGGGWLRHFIPADRYRGIDGSSTPYADEIADLTRFRSSADGIFIRHVLEHNHNWRAILENAVASFRRKLVLIVFTPLTEETHTYSENPDLGVPDIAFREGDITCFFGGLTWRRRIVVSDTQYGQETLFYVRR